MSNKAEATYGPGRSSPSEPVHDHGPDEGPGMACHETLVGSCRVLSQKVYEARLVTAARVAVREMDKMQARMQEAEAKVQAVRQFLYGQSTIHAKDIKKIIDPGPALVD